MLRISALALVLGARAAGLVVGSAVGAQPITPLGVPRWTVSPLPFFDSFRPGQADTSPLLEASGATRLPNGEFVVGDNGYPALRWYAPDGRLVRMFGRRGDGPGEFQLAHLVGTCGHDSLFVFDGASRRLTTVDLRGKFVGTRFFFTDSIEKSPPSMVACGASRLFGVLGWPRGSIPGGDIAFRSEVAVRLQPTSSTDIVPVAVMPSSERQRFGTSAGPRPLGKRTTIAVGKFRVFVGTGDSAKIHAFALGGARLRDISLPFRRYPIRKHDVEVFIETLIERNPKVNSSRIRDTYGGVEYPEFYPAHGAILVDASDRLWVEEFRWPGVDRSRWAVFAHNGNLEADVILPPRFRAFEIGLNYVLGTWADNDGVLHVRAYEFKRGVSVVRP